MNNPALIKEFAFLAGAAILLMFVAFIALRLYRRSQTRPGDLPPGLTVQDLQSLEKKHLLTPEEMKRVREAMARQYLDNEKERALAATPPGEKVSGVELLALEAQRIEAERAFGRKKSEKTESQSSAPTRGETALPSTSPDESAPAAQKRATLSPRLESVAQRSRADLEDLVLAGFLTQQDMELVLRHRGEEL